LFLIPSSIHNFPIMSFIFRGVYNCISEFLNAIDIIVAEIIRLHPGMRFVVFFLFLFADRKNILRAIRLLREIRIAQLIKKYLHPEHLKLILLVPVLLPGPGSYFNLNLAQGYSIQMPAQQAQLAYSKFFNLRPRSGFLFFFASPARSSANSFIGLPATSELFQ